MDTPWIRCVPVSGMRVSADTDTTPMIIDYIELCYFLKLISVSAC